MPLFTPRPRRVAAIALAVMLAMPAAPILQTSQWSAAGWMSAGRDEARIYLQDQLWSATRGEQRRIQRWVMRERLKREGG